MPEFKKLRQIGSFGNFLANLLSLLTAQWGIAVSVVIGLVAASWQWLTGIVLNPATIAGVGVFLALLWTFIGITVLVDRRKPRTVRPYTDYRYGLTFEGLQPRYTPSDAPVFEPGSLHFAILLRNFLQSPIRYDFEDIDIRLDTRAAPVISRGTLTGFMARGAGRTSTIRGFLQNHLREFYGSEPVRGMVEFSIVYGPPEGPPVRRLKMSIEIHVILMDEGRSLGWQDGIVAESDEPF